MEEGLVVEAAVGCVIQANKQTNRQADRQTNKQTKSYYNILGLFVGGQESS